MKSEELSDADLIRGCRENNRKSQEMLYRRYAKAMYNLCLVYESDRDNAKDILQDSFIKIFRNIDSFDSQGSLAGGYLSALHYANQEINTNIENIGSQYERFDFGVRLAVNLNYRFLTGYH